MTRMNEADQRDPAEPGDESSYLPRLEEAGCRLVIRDPGWHEHRALKGPGTDINLHVHGPASPEIERQLRFRDRLRADPADRELHQRAKRELAGRGFTYIQQCAGAKSAVVEEILSGS